MDVHVAYGFFLIVGLFSHGISVPVFSNYYDNMLQEGYQVNDDITGTNSYDRYPRNLLSRPYIWQKYGWFPRSLIPSRPRQPSRKHFHLFHLTSRHPNAVSYHVIEKPHATKTIINNRRKVTSNARRSDLYNSNDQHQFYPAQSYYQQSYYQYSGYPAGYGSSFPQTQYGVQNDGSVHDSTYDDILEQVAKPMQFPNTPAYTGHLNGRQNDQASTPIEEAAKEFKLASADMNNMELASLVIYPIPRFRDDNRPTAQTKKSNKKHKTFHNKDKAQKPKLKVKNKEQVGTDLVDKLIKNNKEEKSETHLDSKDQKKVEEDKEGKAMMTEDKEKTTDDKEDDQTTKEEKKARKENKKERENDKGNKRKGNDKTKKVKDDEDDGMDEDEKESTSKDSWNEEDISTNGEEFTSSKRSEIPHVIDEVSNSDEDKVEITDKSGVDDEQKTKTTATQDPATDEEENSHESDELKDQRNGHDKKNDEANAESDEAENKSEREAENNKSHEVKIVEENGPMKTDGDKEQSRIRESEFGQGHLRESDVTNDDTSRANKDFKTSSNTQKSDAAED